VFAIRPGLSFRPGRRTLRVRGGVEAVVARISTLLSWFLLEEPAKISPLRVRDVDLTPHGSPDL